MSSPTEPGLSRTTPSRHRPPVTDTDPVLHRYRPGPSPSRTWRGSRRVPAGASSLPACPGPPAMPAPAAAAAESAPTQCRPCPRDSAASGRCGGRWRAARRPRLPRRAHRRCGAARSGWRPARRLRHRGRVPTSTEPPRGMEAWRRASTKGGTQAPHGNLVNSMAAVTGGDTPPRHLVARTAAVGMVRSRFAELLDEYARWAPATAGTDGRHVHPLRTRPVPDTPRPRARI